MYTLDQSTVSAPVDLCYRVGADVERWPDILPHYRWVRFHDRTDFGTGRVEMAAWRRFGPLRWPVWWVSEMSVDENEPAVHYLHVDGITTGMRVVWKFEEAGENRTNVSIVHEWDEGPRWPLPGFLRRLIANVIIGPVFIHHVASRTLAGVGREAERLHREEGSG